MPFEPRLLAFTCHWCAYAAADLAGINRIPCPPNVHLIRVMCSGMVHPDLVMKAFQQGADGVLIMGCHLGECHYRDGNMRAQTRMTLLGEMLEEMDVEPGRFRLVWCSAVEAERFAGVIREMTEEIRAMGPSLPPDSTP